MKNRFRCKYLYLHEKSELHNYFNSSIIIKNQFVNSFVTQETLKMKIETACKECSRSLFIIDEMDELLPGLIDTIRPYVDYYDHVEGTYYKKLLFLFIR
jgi:hypothetical protein